MKFYKYILLIENMKECNDMDNLYSKTNVIKSLFWKFLERGGTQGIQFIVQIILARILTPTEFGTLAIILVFIDVAQVFIQGGFNTALIQKKNVDNLDYSSVLYFSFFVAFILYVIIFIMSPFIASFYGDVALIRTLRITAIILFPAALNSIQNAFVSKNMLFQVLFRCSFGSTVVSGLIGIVMAYKGFGVWSLVFQQISFYILNSILLWLFVKWRPIFKFSFIRIKELFNFGSKVLVSNLVYRLYMNLRTLIIGRVYTSTDLAYYQRGEQIPRTIVNNIDGSIQSVLLPTLSGLQDNLIKVKSVMRRAVSISSFVVFPMMTGLLICAQQIVVLLLTEKWLKATPFLQIFALTYAIWPLLTINLQPIRALGRSDIILKQEIVKRIIGFIIILISLKFGVFAVAIGALLERIIEVIINALPNKKLINYSIFEQIKDIFPTIINSVVMGIVVYFIGKVPLPNLTLLILRIIFGIVIYLLLSYIFKNDSLIYIIDTLMTMRKKKVTKG